MSRTAWSLVWLVVLTCTISAVTVGCSGPDAPKKPVPGGSNKT